MVVMYGSLVAIMVGNTKILGSISVNGIIGMLIVEKKYNAGYRRHRKVDLIKLKGGKCERCLIEYDGRNGAIFEFHHLDPNEKDFQLGSNISTKAWEVLVDEANKCQLLCANCHPLEHSEEF